MSKATKAKNKKSELESQCEELFSPVISKTTTPPVLYKQPVYYEETWVTYGAFEDPIR